MSFALAVSLHIPFYDLVFLFLKHKQYLPFCFEVSMVQLLA
jgi:hypothetical protein